MLQPDLHQSLKSKACIIYNVMHFNSYVRHYLCTPINEHIVCTPKGAHYLWLLLIAVCFHCTCGVISITNSVLFRPLFDDY